MNIEELFEFLYSNKQILNQPRDANDMIDLTIRAKQINSLMKMQIFDNQFINSLNSRTPYTEIESIYQLILQSILERVSLFSRLRKRNYHIIVTGGINFRKETIGNEVAIVLEWPLIKFFDLLNCNALKSDSFEHFRDNCDRVIFAYQRRYCDKEDINLFS